MQQKILILTTISGFLTQFEWNDVRILQEYGYEIHYASNFLHPVYEVEEKIFHENGVITHHIDIQKSPLHLRKNCKALKQLMRILDQEKISFIHCHNPMGGVLGRIASFLQHRKMYLLYTAHGFHFYKNAPLQNWLLYFPVEYLLARCTDCLLTINREDYQWACRFPLKKDGKAVQIPGVGVRTQAFAPKKNLRQQMRQKLGIEEDVFYILSVGELNRNKNHEVIIRAIALLQDKKIHYGICGRGGEEAQLRKLARRLGVEDQITLFGFRKDIPSMLQCADCFAFPSKREGLGIAALEAMAGGIPMITSDCRGTREYMEHNVNGVICLRGSVEEYKKAIYCLKNDKNMRGKMAEACIEKAKHFDIAEADKIMRQVYAQLPEMTL